MNELAELLRIVSHESDFSGALRVHAPAGSLELTAGYADRANGRPNASTTRFATASATKGFTALTIASLIEDGAFELDTTVVSLVGDVLSNIDERVTIEHLLGHRSGIGDYLDEAILDDIEAHVLGGVSAHVLDRPSAYLDLLAAPPQQHTPGERFAYNNSGFVILSLVIERLTGSFVDAVAARVLEPAGMTASGFFRSDDLPGDVALGYLRDGRTNVFHLPVVGAGDGGAYTCLDDLDRFWDALLGGGIVSPAAAEGMTTPTSVYDDGRGYGLGFWVQPDGNHVWLEGMDAGVSFQSGFVRSSGARYSVLANTSSGAWPMVRAITDELERG